MCVIESAALSAFALLVTTQLDPGTALLLVPGIFTQTALINMACTSYMKCKQCRDRQRNEYTSLESSDEADDGSSSSSETQDTQSIAKKRWRKIQFLLDNQLTSGLGFIMQLVGLLAFAIYLCANEQSYMPGLTALICGLTLSFVWSAGIQQKIFKAHKDHTTSSNTPNTKALPRLGSPQYPASRKAGRGTCVV